MPQKEPNRKEAPRVPHGSADKSFYSIENTASATECTGLMPALPADNLSHESLSELMAIHGPDPSIAEDPGYQPPPHGGARPSGAHN